MIQKPDLKPDNPSFSCGPCAKRPGWSVDALINGQFGRSHRSAAAKARMHELVQKSRELLGVPDDYLVGITPASDTGAIEMAMWNMLGAPGIGVDVFYWEHFGRVWAKDVEQQLQIGDRRIFDAEFGKLPDLFKADPDRDLIFVWNGTTSGVAVPHADWLPTGGKGLRMCDATSAAFAYELPWEKLDVITWSWQKVMGSEAQHGMLALSPRAVERVKSYKPSWPIPKIYNLNKGDDFYYGLFDEVTANTPSMMCVEDALDSLKWMESIGGRAAIQKRVDNNIAAIIDWEAKTDWLEFLCHDRKTLSRTSPCFKLIAPEIMALSLDKRWEFVNAMAALLEDERAAYDIKCYATAPAGLRFWCGGTVELENLKRLFPWVEWAYAQTMDRLRNGTLA